MTLHQVKTHMQLPDRDGTARLPLRLPIHPAQQSQWKHVNNAGYPPQQPRNPHHLAGARHPVGNCIGNRSWTN